MSIVRLKLDRLLLAALELCCFLVITPICCSLWLRYSSHEPISDPTSYFSSIANLSLLFKHRHLFMVLFLVMWPVTLTAFVFVKNQFFSKRRKWNNDHDENADTKKQHSHLDSVVVPPNSTQYSSPSSGQLQYRKSEKPVGKSKELSTTSSKPDTKLLLEHPKTLNTNSLPSVLQHAYNWIVGSALYFILSVLLGSSLIEDLNSTLLFSMTASSVSFLSVSVLLSNENVSYTTSTLFFDILFCSNLQHFHVESVILIAGTMIGGWLGAIPIPLDWERPWQVWPISCVLGICVIQPFLVSLTSIFNLDSFILSRFK